MVKLDLRDNPLHALYACMSFPSRDWSENKQDAWMYGIVVGWPEAEAEIIEKQHKWDEQTMGRMKKLHEEFVVKCGFDV